MSVVSLPKAFVMHFSADGVHPTPWIRVKISAAIGACLYPDLQWQRLAAVWESLYPLENATASDAAAFRALDRVIPRFAQVLCGYRPQRLGGMTLAQVLPIADRTPAQLRMLWQKHRRQPHTLSRLSPSVACAVLGQAKFDGWLAAPDEVALLRRLLRFWALQSTIDAREVCAQAQPMGLAVAV